MTDAEKAKLNTRRQYRSWAAIVAVIVIVVSMASTGLIVLIVAVMGHQAQDSRDRNHEVSVCTLSFFHAASASSGKTPAETKRAFDTIFQEQWLIDNCALTTDEAHRIVTSK